MVGSDLEKELRSKRIPEDHPSTPDYVKLSGDKFELKASGTGFYETEDGAHRLNCRGVARWTRRQIHARIVVEITDLKQLFDVAESDDYARCRLTTEDESDLTISRARIALLENNRFNILGLEVFRERALTSL